MDIRETLRLARHSLVGINPASVVLKRKAKVLNNYGAYIETTTPLPEQKVRFARPRTEMAEEQTKVGGNVTNSYWLLIFDADNPDCIVGDTFEHPGTHAECEIKSVDDYYVEPGGVRLFVRALALEVR